MKSVDAIDAHRVRFVLHKPWPDVLVFHATPATGATSIMPKKFSGLIATATAAQGNAATRHAPIFEPATLHGVGPRVEVPAVGLNTLLYMAAPYEEMRLNKP